MTVGTILQSFHLDDDDYVSVKTVRQYPTSIHSFRSIVTVKQSSLLYTHSWHCLWRYYSPHGRRHSRRCEHIHYNRVFPRTSILKSYANQKPIQTTPQAGFNAPTAIVFDTAAVPTVSASTSTKAVIPTATSSSASATASSSSSGTGPIPTGAIVILVVSGVVLLSLAIIGVAFYMRHRRRRRHNRISHSASPFGPKGSGGVSLGSLADEGKWTRVVDEPSPAGAHVEPMKSRESLWVPGPKIVDIPRRPPRAAAELGGGYGYGHSISELGSTSRHSVSEMSSIVSLRSMDTRWTKAQAPAPLGSAELPPLPDLPAEFDFGLSMDSTPNSNTYVSWGATGSPIASQAARVPSWNPDTVFPIRDSLLSDTRTSLWGPDAYPIRDSLLSEERTSTVPDPRDPFNYEPEPSGGNRSPVGPPVGVSDWMARGGLFLPEERARDGRL